MKKIPKKFTPIIFVFLMASMMAGAMSGVMVYINVGYVEHFYAIWARSFLLGFCIAVPISICARVITQGIIALIVEK